MLINKALPELKSTKIQLSVVNLAPKKTLFSASYGLDTFGISLIGKFKERTREDIGNQVKNLV
jgi:hypothetical protein